MKDIYLQRLFKRLIIVCLFSVSPSFYSPVHVYAATPKESLSLIQQLNDKEPFMRGQAADRLGLLKEKQAVPLLGKLLLDDSADRYRHLAR